MSGISLSYLSFSRLFLFLIASAFIGIAISFADLFLFHLFLFICTIVLFYKIKENQYSLDIGSLFNPHVSLLVIIFAWYLISLFWAPSLELGIKYNFYIFCGLFIVTSIVFFCTNIDELNQMFKTLSVFVSIEIVIAFFESFTSFRMPISSHSSLSTFFGKEPVNFSVYDNIFLLSSIRPPTGFRWNTNDLAISMIIALPFFLCIRKTSIRILGIFSITIIIAMTASRAVFLALIFSFLLYLFLIKKKIGTIVLIVSISIGIFLGMNSFTESDNPRINELANSIQALIYYVSGDFDVGGSLEWRRELIENGLIAFKNTNGLGLGAGGSVANQELIGPVAGRFTSMHNFWIEVFVEGGILISVIGLFLIFNIIYNLFRISKSTKNQKIQYFSQSLFLSITTFIPAAIAASSTIYFLPMWIMFGFAISLISISKK
tara:strand:+ start:301 stop:1599 length:1299 start_codon:yes stop_codon:yes gene_type:complete